MACFVNSPQNRLTRGQPYTLRDGDTVYIDDYEVRVTLGVEATFIPNPTPAATLDDGFEEPAGVDDTDPLKLLGLGSRSVARGPHRGSFGQQVGVVPKLSTAAASAAPRGNSAHRSRGRPRK